MSRATLILASPSVRDKAHEEKPCAHCGKVFQRDTRYSRKYFSLQKFCCQACFGEALAGRGVVNKLSMEESFWRWVSRGDGCWEWKGAKDKDGYGILTFRGKTYRANRVSLQLDGRPAGKGTYACHHCDNPACVNPRHLYPGTPSQNVADARRRKRLAVGERRSKLTNDQVLAIRGDPRSCTQVCKDYGVSHSLISMIRSYRIWKHLP